MKSLENQFVANYDKCGNNTFTCVKRNDKAAIYERTSPDGGFPMYEVFAIKTVKAGTKLPDGNEVKESYEKYPTKNAFGKWAWCTTSVDRANKHFDRICGNEAVVVNCDAVTDEIVQPADDLSLEEIPDPAPAPAPAYNTSPEHQDSPTIDPIVGRVLTRMGIDIDRFVGAIKAEFAADPSAFSVPINMHNDDPTAPAPVKVKAEKPVKIKKIKEINYVFPAGKFTRGEFAALNNMSLDQNSYLAIRASIDAGKIKEDGKAESADGVRGKKKSLYSVINITG